MSKTPIALICVSSLFFAMPVFAGAAQSGHAPPFVTAETSSATTTSTAIPVAYQTTPGQTFSVYLTGYSFWDNTPPGSAAIARPVLRKSAGGTGTYNDPITIAVGHSFATGRQVLDFPPGTRFYFPALKRYAIVEDVCGDGPTPQFGPCHVGRNGMPWLDIYVDGRQAGQAAANSCMRRITGVHKVIVDPPNGFPVVKGALTESGCRT
ncbi:hypothetical protein [Pseudotabrizicola sp. L79]|uniref:hypothetical protein n=1 Tax=Pseudotabrizicola sp. L79 TaxID=3118402 RepID=UPI002F92F065